MLPHVIRFNSALVEPALEYRDLFDGDLADRVSILLNEAGLPGKLGDLGVTQDSIPQARRRSRHAVDRPVQSAGIRPWRISCSSTGLRSSDRSVDLQSAAITDGKQGPSGMA